jgi:putative iron-dependent peroxidase
VPNPQAAVFRAGTLFHWFLHYGLDEGVPASALAGPVGALRKLAADLDVALAVGFGSDAWSALAPADRPESLRPFTEISGAAGHVAVATQEDLFLWVHSDGYDRNFDFARGSRRLLDGVAHLARETPSFVYRSNRDMTGFVDGTENPSVDEAPGVCLIPDGEVGAGGTFALAQRYIHDLEGFAALPVSEQEAAIGRTKATDEELDPQPDGSHLSRVVIEDDDGAELEIFRRSVPYGNALEAGLYFLAFTRDLDIVQSMLERMYGASGDGAHDRLMDFSHPVSGAYYFVPSVPLLDRVAPIA